MEEGGTNQTWKFQHRWVQQFCVWVWICFLSGETHQSDSVINECFSTLCLWPHHGCWWRKRSASVLTNLLWKFLGQGDGLLLLLAMLLQQLSQFFLKQNRSAFHTTSHYSKKDLLKNKCPYNSLKKRKEKEVSRTENGLFSFFLFYLVFSQKWN